MRFITTALEAEENAASQMRTLGYFDAQATNAGPDGGIDVSSDHAIAQVKWRGAAAGRPDLQHLVGARGNDHHLDLLFFAASSYTEAARVYAQTMGIALFTYDPTGEVAAVGEAAERLVLRARDGASLGEEGGSSVGDGSGREALLEARAWLMVRLRRDGPTRRRTERPGWWRTNWPLVVAITLAVGAVGTVTEAGVPIGERLTSLFGGLLFAAAFGFLYYRRRSRAKLPGTQASHAHDHIDVVELRREVRSLAAEAFDDAWTSFTMYCHRRVQNAGRGASGHTLRLRVEAEVHRVDAVAKRTNGRMSFAQVKSFIAEIDDARSRLDRLR